MISNLRNATVQSKWEDKMDEVPLERGELVPSLIHPIELQYSVQSTKYFG
jgi:hypothetical protein